MLSAKWIVLWIVAYCAVVYSVAKFLAFNDHVETVVMSEQKPSFFQKLSARLNAFWWWLWTGHTHKSSVRRAIEVEARRFGGTVKWDDQN